MARPSRFSPEVRDRTVRMALEHEKEHASQWAAITSIAEKIRVCCRDAAELELRSGDRLVTAGSLCHHRSGRGSVPRYVPPRALKEDPP